MHLDVYIPLVIHSENCCDIDYLAMIKYQTSDNEFDLKFVPVDLYPSKCRAYYVFSQVVLSSYAIKGADSGALASGF